MRIFRGKWKNLLWVMLAAWLAIPVVALSQADPPANRISLKKARAIALRKCPGKVRNYEFKPHKDKWVYFFKILDKKQAANYLYIDAVTGKVVTRFSDPAPKPMAEGTPGISVTPSATKPVKK